MHNTRTPTAHRSCPHPTRNLQLIRKQQNQQPPAEPAARQEAYVLSLTAQLHCCFAAATECRCLSNLLLLVKLTLLLGRGVLVLLVLRHQVIHVALCLSELHLIHTLTSVPVKESLAPEHGCELL